MVEHPWKACPACENIRRGRFPEGYAADRCEFCRGQGHLTRMETASELEHYATGHRARGYPMTAEKYSRLANELCYRMETNNA